MLWPISDPKFRSHKPTPPFNCIKAFLRRGIGHFTIGEAHDFWIRNKVPKKGPIAPSHPLAVETAMQLLLLTDSYPELPNELLEETARSKARNNLRRERRSRV